MGLILNPITGQLDFTGGAVPITPGEPIVGGTPNSILVVSSTSTLGQVGPLTNGQVLIGSTGNPPVPNTLTGTANQIIVTNGSGSIGLSLPQSIATSSSPTFNALTITNNISAATYNSYIPENVANKGAANGYAPLDGSTKIPVAYLPSAVMEYQGAWNPSTNTPTLSDGTSTNGFTYRVNTAFTGSIAGLTDPSMSIFYVGDFVVYSGSLGQWQRSPAADGVTSVNTLTGAVVLTQGNLTDVGTDGITVTNGTNAVWGTGTSISQHVATASFNGYLSSTDWSTFNGKQAAGSYITALTGDGTATGPGSVVFTLATVNSNIGTFASSTVNAKGLVTAAANLSGDATTSGSALTLATVNSNVGSFTNANITVNAKGLITAAANGSGSSGTVSSVSVVSSNGFAGTVATATTTPAITLSTTITGILQGNGTAISAASSVGSGNIVLASNGFAYLSSSTSVYGGTNSTLSFTQADTTVVGVGAGAALTSGAGGNTIYGYNAGNGLTTASSMTFIGYGAGSGANPATDSSLTLIGYGTNVDSSGYTNSTGLGNGATIGASNQMAFGNSSITTNRFYNALNIHGSFTGTIAIATQAAAGTYNFNLPITVGSAGQVLTSQAGGSTAMTWTTPTTGTVTSVGMTVPAFLSVSGTPITSSGTFGISLSGTALPILNGGTGQTSFSSGALSSNGTTLTSGTLSVANGGTGVTSVTTAPTATTFAGWDANKNLSANNLIAGYRTQATAASTLALLVSDAEQQFFTGNTSGQIVTMPVASGVVLGQSWLFTNNSTQSIAIQSSGGNAIVTIGSLTSATITNILASGTTAASWSATNNVTTSTFTPMTVQSFTSSSGTYTTPTSPRAPLYIKIRMVGGGGGGGGSATSAASDAGAGGNGTNTTWSVHSGAAILTAGLGSGGGANSNRGGAGGSVTFAAGATKICGFAGGNGNECAVGSSTSFDGGGMGAASPFGGAGAGGISPNAIVNSGSGGGGRESPAAGYSGSGGGAGGYIEAFISSPSVSYDYAIGSGGSAGTAGTSGGVGGTGGSGIIIVEEFYQ
jgi:hypothetical protein